ncbi:MAG: ArnT family glycosyltransferase [Gammaproteobacteria bacterium]
MPGPGGAVLQAPVRARKHCLYALICLLWMLPGLLGRAPWHPDELFLTTIAAQMARDGLRFVPHLLGEPFLDYPPLYLWLAALSAKVFSFLPPHEGARLANIPLLTAGFGFLYLAGARRYGAATGWIAVLFALGTAGFMIRAHLLTPGVAAFAASAALLWGAMLVKKRALFGGAVCGGALGFVFWSAGVAPACAAFLFLALLFFHRQWRHSAAGLLAAVAVALPLLLLWPAVLAQRHLPLFGQALSSALPPFAPDALITFPALFGWALFPALPITLAGLIWFWRRAEVWHADGAADDKAAATSVVSRLLSGGDGALFAAGLLFVAASLSLLWGDGGTSEEDLFFALPPLSFIAARFMRKLPDDAALVLDWFALLVAGVFCTGAAWVLWLSLLADAPAFAVGYLAQVFPGYVLPSPSPFAVFAAFVVSALWCALIANFGRSNERAVVNWSCGVTVVWFVFNALWLGYVDSAKSYRTPAQQIAAQMDGGCIIKSQSDAPMPMLAQLSYWGAAVGGGECAFVLRRGENGGGGAQKWQGGRPGKTKYRLYQVK